MNVKLNYFASYVLILCITLPINSFGTFKQAAQKSQGHMMLHEYLIDLFQYNPVPTELFAYEVLKKNPIKKKVNYLVIPWWVLVRKKKLHMVPRIRLNGGFTICQRRNYELILPILKKIGIDTLFATHAKENHVYEGIKILPFPHLAVNGVPPAAHKDVLYSFVGYENNEPIRRELFQIPVLENCIIIERKNWYFVPQEKEIGLNVLFRYAIGPKYWVLRSMEEEKKEYQDILARTRFSLCPRGTGANTIRFWESLQAGAIPVVISDDMTLPAGFDWAACIIRVPEKDVLKINDIIRSISLEQEEKMKANCLKAYALFSGDNFVSTVRWYYENPDYYEQ